MRRTRITRQTQVRKGCFPAGEGNKVSGSHLQSKVLPKILGCLECRKRSCPSPSAVLSAVSRGAVVMTMCPAPTLGSPEHIPVHPKGQTLPRLQHHPSSALPSPQQQRMVEMKHLLRSASSPSLQPLPPTQLRFEHCHGSRVALATASLIRPHANLPALHLPAPSRAALASSGQTNSFLSGLKVLPSPSGEQ